MSASGAECAGFRHVRMTLAKHIAKRCVGPCGFVKHKTGMLVAVTAHLPSQGRSGMQRRGMMMEFLQDLGLALED